MIRAVGNTVAVQARIEHGQDGRREHEPDSQVQVDQNSFSASRVSDQCWLRWESLRVSRRLSEQGDRSLFWRITPVSVTAVSS